MVVMEGEEGDEETTAGARKRKRSSSTFTGFFLPVKRQRTDNVIASEQQQVATQAPYTGELVSIGVPISGHEGNDDGVIRDIDISLEDLDFEALELPVIEHDLNFNPTSTFDLGFLNDEPFGFHDWDIHLPTTIDDSCIDPALFNGIDFDTHPLLPLIDNTSTLPFIALNEDSSFVAAKGASLTPPLVECLPGDVIPLIPPLIESLHYTTSPPFPNAIRWVDSWHTPNFLLPGKRIDNLVKGYPHEHHIFYTRCRHEDRSAILTPCPTNKKMCTCPDVSRLWADLALAEKDNQEAGMVVNLLAVGMGMTIEDEKLCRKCEAAEKKRRMKQVKASIRAGKSSRKQN